MNISRNHGGGQGAKDLILERKPASCIYTVLNCSSSSVNEEEGSDISDQFIDDSELAIGEIDSGEYEDSSDNSESSSGSSDSDSAYGSGTEQVSQQLFSLIMELLIVLPGLFCRRMML